MTFTLKGLDELDINLEKIVDAVTGAQLIKALEAGYFVFEGESKNLIREPGTGRTYGRHQASAPGEPPATDTGALLNNWPEPTGKRTAKGASVEGGPGQEYAKHLELGTSKTAARPFMRPALDDNKKKIETAVSAILKAAINKAL